MLIGQKIIIVTNADLAGAPIHVLEIARGLKEKGETSIFVFGEIGPIEKLCREYGHLVYVIKHMRSKISPVADFIAIVNILKIVLKHKPSIIHVHSTKAAMLGRCAGLLLGVKVIYTVHGWGFGAGRQPLLSKLIWLIEKTLVYSTSKYIAVSKCDKEQGVSSLRIPEEMIDVIYNGIPDINNHSDREKILYDCIMVARDDLQKDYNTLFKALSILKFRLAVVGRGTDTIDFKHRARMICGENISMVEFLGLRSDIADLLRQSRVFVLSSKYEGLPISIIEAMRAGLPIIASNVGGVPEMVSSENGRLVNAGDFHELASAISYYISNQTIAHNHGKCSRQIFEKLFKNREMLTKIYALYESV